MVVKVEILADKTGKKANASFSNFLCCGSLLGILRPAAAPRKEKKTELPEALLTLPLPRLPDLRPNREELRNRVAGCLCLLRR